MQKFVSITISATSFHLFRKTIADTGLVLKYWDTYQSQTKVIELVWNTPKSGTSKTYRAAKWKFRRILKNHDRILPGKPWGKDPDDSKNFNEVIQ